MEPLPAAGVAAAVGYLCGSLPFSWIAVRVVAGKDLRTVGSGNVGATNASRVLGGGWFPVLFLLDAGKGAGAVGLAGALAAEGSGASWVHVVGALGAVLGHLFPAWLGFRGGKAVATGAGTLAVLHPAAAAAGCGAFLLAGAVCGVVALGAVGAGGTAAAAASWLGRGSPAAERLPVESFLWILAVVVLLRHVPNLRRIAAGTEPRIGSRTAASPADEGNAGKEPPRAP